MLINKNIKLFLSYYFLRLFLGLVFLTCRWKILGLDCFNRAIKNNRPIMLCFWHCDLVFVARYFKNSPLNVYGVSSTHLDSQIMAKLLLFWKIKLIRGSSTRGWANVIKNIIKLSYDSSSIVAISNDGPQGPPRVAKGGSLSAAQKYNFQIISVSVVSSKFWKLKTWDQTLIPKPFSIISLKFSAPYSSGLPVDVKNITDFINKNRSLK